MGDCGIAPEESWSEYDWKFFGDDTPKSKVITYEKIFHAKSITKTIIIKRGSDNKFYIFGNRHDSFVEALNSSDAFVSHTAYVLPVFVHVDVIELVAEEINKVLKSVLLLDDDLEWRKEWGVFLNRKSRFDSLEDSVQFLKPFSIPKCFLPNHLGKGHEGLRKQLESYLTFLMEGIYPYSVLSSRTEKRYEILKQHQIFSVLQLKYAHLLCAWSDRRGKINIFHGWFSELDWVKKIESEEQIEYFKENKSPNPEEMFVFVESKFGNGNFWNRLELLFVKTLFAYEDYLWMISKGKNEIDALYWSGLQNQNHKELAEYLIKNYTQKQQI